MGAKTKGRLKSLKPKNVQIQTVFDEQWTKYLH